VPAPTVSPPPDEEPRPITPEEDESITTLEQNGIFRTYPHQPTANPDVRLSLHDLCDISTSTDTPKTDRSSWFLGMTQSLAQLANNNIFAPFKNASQFLLYNWHKTGLQKSNAEFNKLMNIMSSHEFSIADLQPEMFTAEMGDRLLDQSKEEPSMFSTVDGWTEGKVDLPVPCTGVEVSEDVAAKFTVTGLFFRRITGIIRSTFQSPRFFGLHLTPFKQFSRQPNGTTERSYSELYNSDAFLNEHNKIRSAFASHTLETVIAGIMLWSDSTHLTNFGPASLWPMYLFFGNQSKYDRCRPSKFAAHHLAYIPSVRPPDRLYGFDH
jgi:hypothetical protein